MLVQGDRIISYHLGAVELKVETAPKETSGGYREIRVVTEVLFSSSP
jgi:hypothetical protein